MPTVRRRWLSAVPSERDALVGRAAALDVRLCPIDGVPVEPRWRFDPLKLVPDLAPSAKDLFHPP